MAGSWSGASAGRLRVPGGHPVTCGSFSGYARRASGSPAYWRARHPTATAPQQQQQQEQHPLSEAARSALYRLRRVNVGEARARLTEPSRAREPLYGGISLLHAVAEQRDTAAIQALIPAAVVAGADVNALDSQGCTPLHYAANNPVAEAAEVGLQLLLQAGADPCARAGAGLTPLHTASRNACPAAVEVAVRLLVAAGADVEAALSAATGASRPLHMAIVANDAPAGMAAAVAALIAAGADVEAPNGRGSRPLHLAAARCRGGKPAGDAMRVLLAAGAAVGSLDEHGCAPLHLAIGSTSTSLEAVQLLLAGGADANQPCSAGCWRPLHAAALLPDAPAAEAVISALVASGAEVDAPDAFRHTPLHWVASGGSCGSSLAGSHSAGSSSSSSSSSRITAAAAGVATALLAAGASPCACNLAGQQPLHLASAAAAHAAGAATMGFTTDGDGIADVAAALSNLIDALLAGGAEVDAADAAGLTPLAVAARGGSPQAAPAVAAVIQALAAGGASPAPLLNRL